MLCKSEDWCVQAPWGNIACVSWGNPKNQPVLMVHGYMDTSATFIPILKHLPDTFYYVAVDLPGHGRSDHFPPGPLVCHAHQVETIRRVVDHVKWDRFMFFSHSVGCFAGIYYNYIFPNRITKMVNLDPVPPLSYYCLQEYHPHAWYQFMYNDYYDKYAWYQQHSKKQYTYEQAINLLMKSRKLTREQSTVILSRTLIKLDNGMYRLSWQTSMKRTVGVTTTEDTLIKVFTTKPPPMLTIVASEDDTDEFFKKKGVVLMDRLKKSIPAFFVVNVTGGHDVHFTNPERFVDRVIEFMNEEFLRAKL